jgi:hypothetical protein
MFGRNKKSDIDFEDLARRLARDVIRHADLIQAKRDRVIDDQEFRWLDNHSDYIAPAYTQAVATPANVRRERPSMLGLWRAIRKSRPAPAEPTPAPTGGNWFSANRQP